VLRQLIGGTVFYSNGFARENNIIFNKFYATNSKTVSPTIPSKFKQVLIFGTRLREEILKFYSSETKARTLNDINKRNQHLA
jgi:hypothetical protein